VPRMRVRLARGASWRHLSHPEFVRLLHTAVAQANLPIARGNRAETPYRIVSGPPLPLGYTSRCEYVDMDILRPITSHEFKQRLAEVLPEGIAVLWARRIPPTAPHLRASIAAFCYTIDGQFDPVHVDRFRTEPSWPYVRKKKDRETLFNLKEMVSLLEVTEERVRLCLAVSPQGILKPEEVLESVFDIPQSLCGDFVIERTDIRFVPIYFPRAFVVEGL